MFVDTAANADANAIADSGGSTIALHERWIFYIIYTFLGSIFELCNIQNRVLMNRVIKRLMCSSGQ